MIADGTDSEVVANGNETAGQRLLRGIGRRLETYRQASGLNADRLALRIGVSRSKLYQIEQGEIVKIDTLLKIAEILSTSAGALLESGTEFIPDAEVFFERVREIEANAQKISNFFGPISYLLTSDSYDELLVDMFMESRPQSEGSADAYQRLDRILAILAMRKKAYRAHSPDLVALVSTRELKRTLAAAAAPAETLSPALRRRFTETMLGEVGRIADIMEEHPLNVSAGVFPDLPHPTAFQIVRQTGGRTIVQTSPFRLASVPNIDLGVATITENPEAVRHYEAMMQTLWARSLKGRDGANMIRSLIRKGMG